MAYYAMVGESKLWAMSDGQIPGTPVEHAFRGVTEEQWHPYSQYLSSDRTWQSNIGFFVIETTDSTILVDTGMGASARANGPSAGNLPSELTLAGISISDIDVVVFTHLHPDHVGWNIQRSLSRPRPTFPNARYLVPKLDWNFFVGSRDGHVNQEHIEAQVEPLEDLGILDLVDGEHEVREGIRVIPTPGHTPGHSSVVVEDGDARAIVLGDVVVNPAQFNELSWNVIYEADPTEAEATRRSVVAMVTSSAWLVGAGHFRRGENIGRAVENNGRVSWVPAQSGPDERYATDLMQAADAV